MEQLQPLIIESAQLLLIGMGTVFVILVMMIFLINLMSKWLPDEAVETPHPVQSSATPASAPTSNQNELVAAISVAIKAYRNKHKSN